MHHVNKFPYKGVWVSGRCYLLRLPSQRSLSLRELIEPQFVLGFQSGMGLTLLLSIDICEPDTDGILLVP